MTDLEALELAVVALMAGAAQSDIDRFPEQAELFREAYKNILKQIEELEEN